MSRTIDLGSEILVDQTTIRNPYLRLLAAAIGQRLIGGSPWLAMDKSLVRAYVSPRRALRRRRDVCQDWLQ
jgi:hypothetical protein